MDRRSWPWKKKSSDKVSSTTDSAGIPSSANQQDQISAQTHAHLVELEDQVKGLNEKLSSAQSDMTTKENLVKQHAKVAEEAVSGWEKAEAETLALKQQLESVTMLKLTAEDRASHLDGALKECMKQIRNLKEENEKNLQETISTKTKQWEKVKSEMEAKMMNFEQELLRSSAEIDALSRSLQERSIMLMKINDEKSQADAEIEVLKTNIQSCQREITSLKYELHIASKEVEIRSEEKNMSVRSAEAANKQHIEDVKKITKLETECQRLRGLVRKKLPGPAALAQMKLEVENLGRDYGETRVRQSMTNSSSSYLGLAPEYSIENTQKFHKDNEFLATRLLAMEEETNMLKEALSQRNNELKTSRSICAKTVSKLHSIEANMLVLNEQKSYPKSDNYPFEQCWSQNECNASLTSMSVDGVDEEGSCSESYAPTVISDLSQLRKEKTSTNKKSKYSNQFELMDDFLEMEKLALSVEPNVSTSVSVDKMKFKIPDATSMVHSRMNDENGQQPDLEKQKYLVSNIEEPSSGKFTSDRNSVLLSRLQFKIASIFESQSLDTDIIKVLEDVARIVQDMQEELLNLSSSCLSEEAQATCEKKNCLEGTAETKNSSASSNQDNVPSTRKHGIGQELENAINHILVFIISLRKEVMEVQGSFSNVLGLRENIEEFSGIVDKVLSGEINLSEYVCALSCLLSKARECTLNMFSGKGNDREISGVDCIDKVTLLENKIAQHESANEKFSGDCALISPSASGPEIFKGPISPGYELKASLQKYSLEELEKMKLVKDSMQMNLASCNEALECMKLKLVEAEQNLTELKSQLTSCQKSSSLANTQLKCMTESYKTLESRTQELETELSLLHSKAQVLEHELQEERRSHQDDLARYKDLQDNIERNMGCSICSFHSEANEVKMKQEREITAAAAKLAECQETIFLLGRQLKALHPPAELGSSMNDIHQISDILEDKPSQSGYDSPEEVIFNVNHSDQSELHNITSSIPPRTGGQSSSDGQKSYSSLSNINAMPIVSSSKRQRHRSKSASSSSLSSMLGEKQGRGFSRFFLKAKD